MDLHCSPDSHSPAIPIPGCCSGVLLLLLLLVTPAWADDAIDAQILRLDSQLQQLTGDMYASYASHLKQLSTPQNLQQLQQQVDEYLNQHDEISAISLLHRHKQLIKDNMDDQRMFALVDLLLHYNDWATASEIYRFAKAESEKSLVSNLSFIFAKYYLQRNEWQKTIDTLNDSYEDLAEENGNQARLIAGIALQKLKHHRQALKYYEKIPASSSYYIYARLNTATAYIRQGWWTDAQATIKSSLGDEHIKKTDEMVNRLYLVLGYSMLQKEYYRNSRNAFRHIGLNSRYTSRALLGIALSAANQEDYIGALNALSILKDSDILNLSVDECYLLFPFIYQKLNQQMTASATYSEAISYYQARMLEIDNLKLMMERPEHDLSGISADNKTIIINKNALDYASHYPAAFLVNIKRLQAIRQTLKNKQLQLPDRLLSRLQRLWNEHQLLYSKIVTSLFTERREFLASYLNQSRYGLANLYDSSLMGGK